MTTLALTHEKRTDMQRIAAKHGVSGIRVFHSVARGEAGAESDVGGSVEAGPVRRAPGPSFPASGLIVDLEDLLGRRVEVVTSKGLNPDLREHVLAEAVLL